MIVNLLKETLDVLSRHNKTLEDIRWVGNDKKYFLLPFFIIDAEKCNYNNGYGWPVIDHSLKIVGDDWWLERAEYDGSEWWEFKTLPKRPDYCTMFINFKGEDL